MPGLDSGKYIINEAQHRTSQIVLNKIKEEAPREEIEESLKKYIKIIGGLEYPNKKIRKKVREAYGNYTTPLEMKEKVEAYYKKNNPTFREIKNEFGISIAYAHKLVNEINGN